MGNCKALTGSSVKGLKSETSSEVMSLLPVRLPAVSTPVEIALPATSQGGRAWLPASPLVGSVQTRRSERSSDPSSVGRGRVFRLDQQPRRTDDTAARPPLALQWRTQAGRVTKYFHPPFTITTCRLHEHSYNSFGRFHFYSIHNSNNPFHEPGNNSCR